MIIDYDHNQNLNTDRKLDSLKESVQMALNEIETNLSKLRSSLLDVKKLFTKMLHAEFYGHQGGVALTSKSLTSGTSWQELGHFTLPKGVWLVKCSASFPSNATGRRVITIADTSAAAGAVTTIVSAPAVNGYATYMHSICFWVSDGTSPIYFNGLQNSGSTLSVTLRYTAYRIGDSVERLDT